MWFLDFLVGFLNLPTTAATKRVSGQPRVLQRLLRRSKRKGSWKPAPLTCRAQNFVTLLDRLTSAKLRGTALRFHSNPAQAVDVLAEYRRQGWVPLA